MSNAEDQHHQAVVLDFADEPVGAYLVSPKFPQGGAVQGLSDSARIVQVGYSFMEKLQNAPGVLRVEFLQFPVGLGR